MSVLTARERHVMEHALGYGSRRQKPGWRNHFCAGPGHDDWSTLETLCLRGLMIKRAPNGISGGDHIFAVTMAGEEALKPVSR